MLKSLHIKNYALIEEAKLQFEEGFTVITGETGAGKSILLGALGLILGKRADLGSIGDAENKCVIEAQFAVGNYDLKTLFAAEDLDYEPVTIVRREILPSGKSRAFVNDTPVTLNQLSALGERLVDIHSQQQTRELTDDDFQLAVLDAFSGNGVLLQEYGTIFSAFKKNQSLLNKLTKQRAEAIKEEEYKNYLLEELLTINLKTGEQEELESQVDTLSHVEQITDALAIANQSLTREETGIVDLLTQIKIKISKLAHFSPPLQELYTRIDSLVIELEDVATTVDDIASSTEGDPETLTKAETRLKLLFDLQKKHQVDSVEGLIDVRETLDAEVQSMNDLDGQIAKLEKEILVQNELLENKAVDISGKREKHLLPLTKKLEDILAQVGMPNARFSLSLARNNDFNAYGKDDLGFLFNANKGMRPQELKKAASGGELSRIMLAIKSVMSSYAHLPTLIFDEIDTGVSGEVALKMGSIMKDMGKQMQLVSITHLPQIAGQGSHHFKVFKEDSAGRTNTKIEGLNEQARINELAEMLGGKSSSEAAMNHAKQLLN